MIRRLFIAALWAVSSALVLGAPAHAQDLTIKSFIGTYTGSGVAKSEDSLYFGVTVRDTDVEIRPTADGFRVTWTTVVRQGGDPNKPNVKKRTSSADFVATAKANFYAGKDNGDPLQGKTVAWAMIKRNTLTTHFVSMDEDGLPDVQTYTRTLTGEGMDLVYSRSLGGEKSRTVKAKLTRQSN